MQVADEHSYADYYRCINKKGEDYEPCKQFFSTFHSLCPNEWVRIETRAVADGD